MWLNLKSLNFEEGHYRNLWLINSIKLPLESCEWFLVCKYFRMMMFWSACFAKVGFFLIISVPLAVKPWFYCRSQLFLPISTQQLLRYHKRVVCSAVETWNNWTFHVASCCCVCGVFDGRKGKKCWLIWQKSSRNWVWGWFPRNQLNVSFEH